MLTDHKPLTHSLTSKPDRHSPREVCHLDFISQFTSDIRHMVGAGNPVANVLSHLKANAVQFDHTPASIDFEAFAKAQPTDDDDLDKLQSATSTLKLERLSMPMCSDTLLCDTSVRTPRP